MTPYRHDHRIPAFDPSDEVCGPIRDAWAIVRLFLCITALALAYVYLDALAREKRARAIPAPNGVRILPTHHIRRPARRGTVSP